MPATWALRSGGAATEGRRVIRRSAAVFGVRSVLFSSSAKPSRPPPWPPSAPTARPGPAAVRGLLARGQLDDGASITALLYLLAFAPAGTAIKPADTVPEAGAT